MSICCQGTSKRVARKYKLSRTLLVQLVNADHLAGSKKLDRLGEFMMATNDFNIYVVDRKTWFLAWNIHI